MTDSEVKPPFIAWDIVVSIVVWAITAALIGVCAVAAIVGLALIDYCPAPSCNLAAAASCLLAAAAASVVVALAGLASGLVRIFRRALSWWLAVGAFVLCIVCWTVGFLSAGGAVGW
ncbi:hypothetical protein [Humibacter ginsenosidimutans]|uniref:Uncharacterized protein n=1 Tax=Humibacter ginsenosidimutans TaxID=2599293 RepID=A0A5B8M4C1_9MICO|nr:hypothetical protein [Humibacter ginsenosidimutans]QDZ15173.1 hypothetical protein FPZ11_10700 [Humibacter ginsenosidimutans]